MEFIYAINVIISCLGYAINQVETSNIDIMGFRAAGYDDDDAKNMNLKLLAEVYRQLDNLTYSDPYYGLTRKHLEELLNIDVEV